MSVRSLLVFLICGASVSFPARAEPVRLLSTVDPLLGSTASADGDSGATVISPDGRYVLFASTALNLVTVESNRPLPAVFPASLNVFLRDRSNGITTLVSVSTSGLAGGNDNSLPVAVSTDGRYVLFESSASNLVPNDTNNASDIFVRDLVSGTTVLASATTNGTVGNGISSGSAMTPDGRYVAFFSSANNLVPNDTNGIPDVFVRDLQDGTTTLASPGARKGSTTSVLPSDGSPEITPDGRFIAFHSTATNLVAGMIGGDDIYVRDTQNGLTYQASRGAPTAIQSVLHDGTSSTYDFRMSDDGRFVAYAAAARNGTVGLVLRYDLTTGQTDLVHTNTPVAALFQSRNLDMTPDGRFIVFVGKTNQLPSGDTSVLVWDTQTATTRVVGLNTNGVAPAGSTSDSPVVDRTGRFIAFLSSAPGLVTNELAGDYHLYVRDLEQETTVLVDADTSAAGVRLSTWPVPSLSADGRFVAFEAPDSGLTPGDRNRRYDVFMRDLSSGSTEMLSTRDGPFANLAPDGPTELWPFSVSADGRYIAFSSEADDLVTNDNNQVRDIFLRDNRGGFTALVSVAADGLTAGNGLSTDPALSMDGRFLFFTSYADNLVAGDTNQAADVFMRDLQTGTTTLISTNAAGTGPGNRASFAPLISADARYVLFFSMATDLKPGMSSATRSNLFFKDLLSGKTSALSTNGASSPCMTLDGHFVLFVAGPFATAYVWDSVADRSRYNRSITVGSGVPVGLSPDGQDILYSSTGIGPGLYVTNVNGIGFRITSSRLASRAGLRFTPDSRYLVYAAAPGDFTIAATNQVYLYDFTAAVNVLISKSRNGGVQANASSDSPDISADGRFIAYRSFATDVVAGDSNDVPAIFLYDRQSGKTTLVSSSQFGAVRGNNRSLSPMLTGDSRTLFFESWASDLVPGDFNLNSDLFALQLYPAPFSVQIDYDAQGPCLSWSALPGTNYRAQYKDDLSQLNWSFLNGAITIVGGMATVHDTSAGGTQRFYRISAF